MKKNKECLPKQTPLVIIDMKRNFYEILCFRGRFAVAFSLKRTFFALEEIP
jgi:hypothetical protein